MNLARRLRALEQIVVPPDDYRCEVCGYERGSELKFEVSLDGRFRKAVVRGACQTRCRIVSITCWGAMWSRYRAVVAMLRWPSCLEMIPISTPSDLMAPRAILVGHCRTGEGRRIVTCRHNGVLAGICGVR